MNHENNAGKDTVELTVKPLSAIEFMHAINNQQLPWDLNMFQQKSGPTSMVFDVEQESTGTGMQIILKDDGTWNAEYTASIKLEA